MCSTTRDAESLSIKATTTTTTLNNAVLPTSIATSAVTLAVDDAVGPSSPVVSVGVAATRLTDDAATTAATAPAVVSDVCSTCGGSRNSTVMPHL